MSPPFDFAEAGTLGLNRERVSQLAAALVIWLSSTPTPELGTVESSKSQHHCQRTIKMSPVSAT